MMGNTDSITISPPSTLEQFYSLMAATRAVRTRIVDNYLNGSQISPNDIASLKNARVSLESIPRSDDGNGYEVALDEEKKTIIDLSYEISELGKDLIFLEKGEDALLGHFRNLYSFFSEQVEECVGRLRPLSFRSFITDRDGTVNNYCARYLSSIQSVYNAVFLTRFARNCVKNAVMLTSAPLRDGGLVDISTMPKGALVCAGSKGREYYDQNGNYGSYPVDEAQQKKLDLFNEKLAALLAQPGNEKFTLIGSGFQKKFGQTTIARQDINKSVPQEQSAHFRTAIEQLVSEIDPRHKDFRIEDTGYDLEIILTISDDSSGTAKDFDKGDAVAFLDSALDLGLEKGPTLVCGDTNSDVPMIPACVSRNNESVAVFATTKDELRNKVAAQAPNSMCVDAVDVLVATLNELGKKKG